MGNWRLKDLNTINKQMRDTLPEYVLTRVDVFVFESHTESLQTDRYVLLQLYCPAKYLYFGCSVILRGHFANYDQNFAVLSLLLLLVTVAITFPLYQ